MSVCDSDSDKTVHIFLGYFFIVNYCLGTGFLGVPFSFFYSGYLAAIPTLIATAFFTWVTSLWLLEIMARAQALESWKKAKDPIFEIKTKRKFEVSELSEIFVGKWFKYTYLIIVIIYGFFGLWSFSSVAGTAWATNIPYNFPDTDTCDEDAFLYQILPSGGCLYSYYFSLFLFALIVVTLSVLNLREQVAIQVTFGVLRYLTVGIIIVYCIVRLFQGGDGCQEGERLLTNKTKNVVPETHYNSTISYKDIVLKFDSLGWMVSVPIYVYAFMIHSGISTLTHPIRQKKYLHWMLLTNFALALACLLSLGLVVPLWFKASIQETITLNWAIYTGPENSLQLRILSYYLMFFPSMDIISAYPLTVHAIMNNIYIIITGNDTSKKPKWRYDWLLRFFLRFVGALLPIIAAYGVANLIYVLTYAGLVGFGVSFLFPTVLQLRSIFVCTKKFQNIGIEDIQLNSLHHTRGTGLDAKSELSDSIYTNGIQNHYDSDANHVSKEKLPLLKEEARDDERRLYMTPYSNAVLSNPIFVGIMGILFICLFIVTCISIFVQPHQLTCNY